MGSTKTALCATYHCPPLVGGGSFLRATGTGDTPLVCVYISDCNGSSLLHEVVSLVCVSVQSCSNVLSGRWANVT